MKTSYGYVFTSHIIECNIFKHSNLLTCVVYDSPEHTVLDVVVQWQGSSFLQPLNLGFYTTCCRAGELYSAALSFNFNLG